MMIVRPSNFFFSLAFLCAFVAGTPALAGPNIDHDKIRLQSLNKSTAETSTFEIDIGETIKLGPLYIRPQACRTNPPTQQPESAGFIQIWTVKESEEEREPESEWVFSGWMFASSPGLSSMDHAVYDLWVIDCGKATGGGNVVAAAAEESNTDSVEEMDSDIIIEDDTGEDAPIVKLDGEEIYVPQNNPETVSNEDGEVEEDKNNLVAPAEAEDSSVSNDARFDAYEEESAPTVRLE